MIIAIKAREEPRFTRAALDELDDTIVAMVIVVTVEIMSTPNLVSPVGILFGRCVLVNSFLRESPYAFID